MSFDTRGQVHFTLMATNSRLLNILCAHVAHWLSVPHETADTSERVLSCKWQWVPVKTVEIKLGERRTLWHSNLEASRPLCSLPGPEVANRWSAFESKCSVYHRYTSTSNSMNLGQRVNIAWSPQMASIVVFADFYTFACQPVLVLFDLWVNFFQSASLMNQSKFNCSILKVQQHCLIWRVRENGHIKLN